MSLAESSTANDIALEEVDLFDMAWRADGPPHALFARLRAERPVHRNPLPGGGFVWSITRHEDIAAISRDTATFSSARGGIFVDPDQVLPLDVMRNMLLYMDPPGHTRYRLILQTAFTPHTVAKIEDRIRARVTRTIDAVIERGRAELVHDLAVPVPLGVLCELLGVPEDDVPQFYDWTERVEASQRDPRPNAGAEVFGEMVTYLVAQIERQTEEGRADSLVMRMRAAEVDGEKLTDLEIVTFFGLLAFAGNDTTRNSFATGMLALLQHPDEYAALAADPTLAESAVEEVLRWTCVVQWFARTATRDTVIAGQRIAEGDKLVLWYGSASRDPAAIDDPDRFDIRRGRSDHKAFGGGGRHFCLGSGLARLELRILLEEVARRMPDLTLAGDVERVPSNWAHGLVALPVAFTPGAREGS